MMNGNHRGICKCLIQTFTAGLHLHEISDMDSLYFSNNVSFFLFQRRPEAIVYKAVLLRAFLNLLTFIFLNLSFNLACRLPPLSSAFKVKRGAFHSPLPPLLYIPISMPSSLHTNYARIPAGFRCKSYLNLSPAATRAARGIEENRPLWYRTNLQNEHDFFFFYSFYGLSGLRSV